MVDRGHLVLLDGAGLLGVGLLAGEHPQVVGAVAEVEPRADRLEALLQAVDRHDQRGEHGAQLQGVLAPLGVVDVEGGLEARGPRPTIEMAERTASITVWLDAASAGSRPTIDSGTSRSGAISAMNAVALGDRGEVALEQQEPHVLEPALVGQLHGVVLAVVVEALLAADVADGCLGHDHALEPGRRLDRRRVHDGLDVRHAR